MFPFFLALYNGSQVSIVALWATCLFCFVVAICDLVHDVAAMYGLPKVLTASGNLF